MLKIDAKSGRLVGLGRPELHPGALDQGHRLDTLIAGSPEAFFAEIDRPFLLLGNLETYISKADSTGFLAADTSGRSIVIAVQPSGGESPNLVGVLETAEAVAGLSADHILDNTAPERAEALRQFLEAPADRLNHEQGVLMIAESFHSEAAGTAEWLRNRYGVRIDCIQVAIAKDRRSGDEFLVVEDLSQPESRRPRSRFDSRTWPLAAPDISDTTPPDAPASARDSELEAAVADATSVAPDLLDAPTAPLESNGAHEADDDADDALAEILELRERAAEAAETAPAESQDRRDGERNDTFQARRLRLNYFGRLLGARFVDFSAEGLGVETLSPLPVGAEIGVSGELVSEDRIVGLEGRARVRHCKPNPDGVCRIGFSLEPAAIREYNNPETFGRR